MKIEDAQKVIESFRNQGKTDEEIAGAFALLYFDNKIDINGFEGLLNVLGYEMDEDFKKLSKEEQMKSMLGGR